ncbi:MAG: sulfatase-like hydrolase/transferase, partial [bacterium]
GYEGLKKERYQRMIAAGVYPQGVPFPEQNPITKQWASLSASEKKTQAKVMATYAAMIESHDFYIGRVMDYLRESGQLDNTLIVYMPDNGPEGADAFGPLSNSLWVDWSSKHFDMSDEAIGTGASSRQTGLEWANATTGPLQWWKWFISEGGVRVPLIVRPPKSSEFDAAGEISDITLSVKDLPATILDYAKVKHPGDSFKGREIVKPSGVSMWDFLEGDVMQVRTDDDWFAFELFGNGFVIQGDYKLMKLRKGMYGDGEWHLYNIIDDPAESQPLEARDPARFESMMALYRSYEKEYGIVSVEENWNPWQAAGE